MKMFYMVGSGIGGYLGWYLGAMVGEFFIPVLVSGIGSIVGIILVWKLQRHFA